MRFGLGSEPELVLGVVTRNHVLGLDEYQLLWVPGCPRPQCPTNLDCRCRRLRVGGWVVLVAEYELVGFWTSRCGAESGRVLVVRG